MTRSARWTLLGLAVLAAAHGGTWFYVTGRIIDGIPAVVAQAAREGWTVQAAGPPRRAGWPWAARVRLPDVTGARPLGGTAIAWTVGHLDLTVHPTDPSHLVIAPGGPGTLRLGNAAPLAWSTARADWAVPLDGAGPGTLAVEALEVDAGATRLRVGGITARIETGSGPGGGAGGGASIVAGEAGPIVMSPALPAPFDGGATLAGRILVTPPFPQAATPGQSAGAWRAAGGRAAVPELHLGWGPLVLDGTLTGGLDPALQPFGEARLRVTGALEVVEALSRAGLVQPGPTAAARAVLSLLALAAHGGPIALPVVLRDRTLTIAQFALTRVPVLAWDAP